MKVVLHAGLHKSGTTTVQNAWRAAFARSGPIWYPASATQRLPGHHWMVWPLMTAFRTAAPADLEAATRRTAPDRPLDRILAEAAARGVETVLISTEELDRFQSEDLERFAFLDAYEVTVLVTVTHPWHRWASGWQTLVRHGLAEYPADAADHVESFGSLAMGRLEELLHLLPANRKVVRLVRTSPQEETLPADLLALVGVDWPEDVVVPASRNNSLGRRVDILRQLNRDDRTTGFARPGRQVLAQVAAQVTEWRERADLAVRYEPPRRFAEAAAREAAWLRAADSIEVVDPHGELARWELDATPSWYREISQKEAVVPGKPRDADLEEQLWRVRQQRSMLGVELAKERERSARERASAAREARRLEARIEELEAGTVARLRRRIVALRKPGAGRRLNKGFE